MRRYAFIDVNNTKSTATVLDFTIDPEKLFNYLKYEKWSCSEVFWYSGRILNEKFEKEREKIEKIGFKINDKETKFYKKTRKIEIKCPTKKKDKWGDYRFSTRYNDLLKQSKVTFIEMFNLVNRLKKEPDGTENDAENKETAAKRDGSERPL